MSGVERVRMPEGRSVILKYAREPIAGEGRILTHVASGGDATLVTLTSRRQAARFLAQLRTETSARS